MLSIVALPTDFIARLESARCISRIEHPSYNTEVNAAFRRINANLRNQPSREATPANSLNGLLPVQKGWLALEEMAPPWLGINGQVGVIGVGWLLSLREVRRRE